MADAKSSRGMIAVDKMGTKALFLNLVTYETEVVLEDFPALCTNCSWCRMPTSLMCRSSATVSRAAIPIRVISFASSTLRSAARRHLLMAAF